MFGEHGGPERAGDGSSDAAPTGGFGLIVLHSADDTLCGRVIPVGAALRIGRAGQEGADLAIDDRLLSRDHASIVRVGETGRYDLVDHGSRNGSFVDGQRVDRHRLLDGSIIRLGVTVFELSADAAERGLCEVTAADGDNGSLYGRSGALHAAVARLHAAAERPDPVLVMGEAGTGAEDAAGRLHRRSGRPGRLVAASASALTKADGEAQLCGTIGANESEVLLGCARHGTLFLDEIDQLPAPLQRRLLAVIDSGRYVPLGSDRERPVEARIATSTDANLDVLVRDGGFDAALLERLATSSIELPSLRSRRADIPLLARFFLDRVAPGRKLDWSATFLEKLVLYDWPMNVRELRTVMQRLSLLDVEITTLRSSHLPREIQKRVRQPTEDQLRASAVLVQAIPSREELAALLARFEGNVKRLAEHYAKDGRLVERWLLCHDLEAADYRKP
jgi:DNA-binding NtrC family response regulator